MMWVGGLPQYILRMLRTGCGCPQPAPPAPLPGAKRRTAWLGLLAWSNAAHSAEHGRRLVWCSGRDWHGVRHSWGMGRLGGGGR
uniref:Uncharacterized protein n=1 Tax=Oryza glumipatula TaxID=40148 RepID=A0A0D9YR57_9ORYZ